MQAHSNLTGEDRSGVCRVLEYHRLSQEARQHVMHNDRLPLKLTTKFVLLEQVNMTRSMTNNGSNYRRTNTQTTIRVSKDFEKRQINAQEIKMMSKDVEMMKSQLLELNTCKMKLQMQLKRCIRWKRVCYVKSNTSRWGLGAHFLIFCHKLIRNFNTVLPASYA